MVRVSASARIDLRPEEVFAFVSNPVNDEKWHHHVKAARKTSEGPIGLGSTFEWDASFLGPRTARLEITRWEPPRLVEYPVAANRLMRVVVRYVVEPEDGAARLTREVGIPAHWIFRPLHPLVRWQGTKSVRHHVEWLSEVLERPEAAHEGHSH